MATRKVFSADKRRGLGVAVVLIASGALLFWLAHQNIGFGGGNGYLNSGEQLDERTPLRATLNYYEVN